MGKKRIRHSPEFKGKVALEALKGVKTVNELASQYQVHSTQISQWKRQVLGRVNELFANGQGSGQQEADAVQAKLYEEVGRLKMELDWVKKLPDSVDAKRQWIVPGHSELSIRRQCELLGLGRANWYYHPVAEKAETLEQAFAHGCPEIFNSDQGCQFTSAAFTNRLLSAGVQISMDGRGRVFDNIFIERLWRTVKYEYVYLTDHRDGRELERGLTTYFQFYNTKRPHQALGYRTPEDIHFAKTSRA